MDMMLREKITRIEFGLIQFRMDPIHPTRCSFNICIMHYVDVVPITRQEALTVVVLHVGDRFPLCVLWLRLHLWRRSADTTMSFLESTLFVVPGTVLGAALCMGSAWDRSCFASGDGGAGRWTGCGWWGRGSSHDPWTRRTRGRGHGTGTIHPGGAVAERHASTIVRTTVVGVITRKRDPGVRLDAYDPMGGSHLTKLAASGGRIRTAGTGVVIQ